MLIVNSDKSMVVFSENVPLITINNVNEILVHINERKYVLQKCVCRNEAENNITKIIDGYLENRKKVVLETQMSQN